MKLDYFKGKICTIFTNPINRDYQKENPKNFVSVMHVYFMGKVEQIDENGIWLTQISTNLKTFFRMSNVIGIAEEEIVKEEPKEEVVEPESPYIDISKISSLLK